MGGQFGWLMRVHLSTCSFTGFATPASEFACCLARRGSATRAGDIAIRGHAEQHAHRGAAMSVAALTSLQGAGGDEDRA